MATKDDLSEQLNITTKLNGLVEKMAKSVADIGDSYETQINTLERLTLAVNGINSTKSVEQLDQIVDSLKAITGQLKKVNDDTTLANMIGSAGKAAAAVGGVGAALGTSASALGKLSDKGTGGMGKFADSVISAATESHKFDKAIEDVSKVMNSKLVKGAEIGVGAIHGFEQGIRNVIALSKGALGFTASLASGLFNIGASIISIPLKIFTGLVDMAASASGGANELMEAIENLRKEMGDLNKSGSKAVLETTKTLKGFSDTGLSTWRVFGTLAERLQLMTKVAVSMGSTFGVLKQEFIDNGGALLAYQKGLGVTDEQMKALGDRAITTGQPLGKMFKDITKQTLALGQAFDIDQKLIGKDISKAVVDVKHFGSVTVKEIGQAAVYARKLGVELDKITGTLDQFETFDSAAESAAKLGQSFGVTVDAFKLMEAQSPAEQIDMLKKSFKDAGVDASTFSRQQLKLLASTTGLDEATAKQVFSMKNQGASLDEIKKKSDTAEKKTLTQTEAMSKLADSIERLVKSGGSQTGSFFDQFVKGFLRGIQSTQEFRQMIMFIKRDLQTAMMAGVQLGRTFEKVFPGVKDFFGGIRDFFEPKRFTKFFADINATFTKFFKDVATGKYSFSELMNQLQKVFFGFFNASEPQGQKTLGAFKKFTSAMADIIGQAIPWIAQQLGKGLQGIADIISGKNKLSGVKAGAEGSLGFMGTLLSPIISGLKKAWNNPEFRNGLNSFVTEMGVMLTKIFHSSTFKTVARTVIGGLITSLFAPVILQGALGGIAGKIGSTVLKTLGAAVFKKGGAGLAEKATTAGSSRLLGTAGPVGLLIAAGAAIGKGVNTYTDQVTSVMNHSSKVIGAGATGIVNALTLGLLPDHLMVDLANTFAKISDMVFNALGSVFGEGFAASMKRKLAGTFEVFGNIYNTISKLFTGNQADFTQAAKDLGFSLLRFVTDALEFTFIQLPILFVKLTAQITSTLVGVIIKLVTLQFTVLTGAIDKAFGTNLSAKIQKISDDVRTSISGGADDMVKDLEKGAKKVSAATDSLENNYMRSAEDRAKAAKAAASTQSQAQVAAIASTNKDVEKSLGSTLDDIKTAKDIQKELSANGGTDFKTLIASVKDKLAGVDFKILTPDQAKDLTDTGAVTDAIKKTVDNISVFFESFGKLPATLKGAIAQLKNDGLKPAMEAVSELVKLANQLDSALADGNLNKVDVKAKLANVANAVGLGGKASYTVTSKPVNITVNMTVTMNVDDIEKAMVMRANSIIRDRLNFATGPNAGRQGTPQIPETNTPNLQRISTSD